MPRPASPGACAATTDSTRPRQRCSRPADRNPARLTATTGTGVEGVERLVERTGRPVYGRRITATSTDQPQRFAGLDGLRALGVVLVIWFHFGAIPGTLRVLGPRFEELGYPRAGYLGAELFFVVSGFLITALLVGEAGRDPSTPRIAVRAFYIRRAYRLLPALLATLAVLWITNAVLHETLGETLLGTVSALGYIYNVVDAYRPRDLGGVAWTHLWSLSVEEQFYLVWPVAVLALLRVRWSRSRTMAVLFGIGIAAGAWRTVLWWNGASTLRLYLLTDARVDALLIGAAGGFFVADRATASRLALVIRSRRTILSFSSMLCVVWFAFVGSRWETDRSPGWMYGPGFTVFSIAAAVLILTVVTPGRSPIDRALNSRVAVAVGRRSYGLYLLHYPMRALALNHRGGWAGAVAATIVLAELSYRFVELPMLCRVPAWARSGYAAGQARATPARSGV